MLQSQINKVYFHLADYTPNLFYKDIGMSEYCDKMAYNYKEKIPRLIGKWDLLKSHLGSPLLYDNLDLFIYQEDSPNRCDKGVLSR
jgi:hypothetical protein